jgi:hypothetical protein
MSNPVLSRYFLLSYHVQSCLVSSLLS